MKTETIVLNNERNVTLTTYLQDCGEGFGCVSKRPAVLVLPGGGYQMCSDREADPVALAYAKAGYQTFILRYSIQADAIWPNPLNDYEEAMTMIRQHADDWHLYSDKIAVIGFSAGGHLAAAAATLAKNRPDAAILGYAVTSEDVKGCNPSAPDTISAVDANTPPCFVFATRTDTLVPINNSIDFMRALSDHGIAFESHIYAYGPHGFSTCESTIQDVRPQTICSRVPNWVGDSIGWLQDIFGACALEGMTEPLCPTHINDDHLPYLTIDCSFSHIMSVTEGAKLLQPIIDAMIADLSDQAKGMSAAFDETNGASMVSGMKLRDLLAFGNMDKEKLAALDSRLRQISVN